MKTIPQSFSFEENWQNILKLEELLRKRGLDIPAVFVFSCTVAILEKSSTVRGPFVVKRMSKIGTPYKDLDSEASELLNLFNDYLYDNEQNFIPA